MGVPPQPADPATGSGTGSALSDPIPITFALVGVQKAATSTIAFYLRRHRHVSRGDRKEIHFFDDEHLDWDDPDYRQYGSPRSAPRERVAGDFTPSYLFWPQALQRMHRYNPEMSLIAAFRDPIERTFSQWQMGHTRYQVYPAFAQVIANDTFATIPDRIPDGWTPGRLHRRSMVTRGLYGAQLERAFEIYPDRSRWLLLDFLDVITDRDGLLAKLTGFLGLAPFVKPPGPQAMNATRAVDAKPPTADDMLRMTERFAPDLPLFEKLSGIDTARWATSRILAGTLDPADLAEKLARKAGMLR